MPATPDPAPVPNPVTGRIHEPRPAAAIAGRRISIATIALITVAAVLAAYAAIITARLVSAEDSAASWFDRATSLETDVLDRDAEITRVETQRDNLSADLEEQRERFEELEAAEAALAEREAAVTQEEAAAAMRAFGNGLHVIGTTVEPGVYSTPGQGTCYYAWMAGTGADADIIDNNIVSGPVTVTLQAGDVFESSRCGTWTRTG